MAKPGRPSKLTPELTKEICKRLEKNPSLRKVCRDPDMPSRNTVWRWTHENKEFSDQYTRAKILGYEDMFEQCMEIADEDQYDMTEDDDGKPMVNWEHFQRTKIRLDTRKWWLSKALPKIYGDKIQQEHSGPDGGPMQVVAVDRPSDETREEWLKRHKAE